MLSHASGENILVELEIEGEKAGRLALVQEVQHAPLGGDILHIDFHAVSMDEMIEADVPLEPTGTAEGVKTFGGLLEQSSALARDRMSAARFAGCHHGRRFRISISATRFTCAKSLLPARCHDPRAGGSDRVLRARADGRGRTGRGCVEAPTAPEVITAKKEEAGSDGCRARPRQAREREGSEEVASALRAWSGRERSSRADSPGRGPRESRAANIERTRHNIGFMVLDRLAADAAAVGLFGKWSAGWAKSGRDPGQARKPT